MLLYSLEVIQNERDYVAQTSTKLAVRLEKRMADKRLELIANIKIKKNVINDKYEILRLKKQKINKCKRIHSYTFREGVT